MALKVWLHPQTHCQGEQKPHQWRVFVPNLILQQRSLCIGCDACCPCGEPAGATELIQKNQSKRKEKKCDFLLMKLAELTQGRQPGEEEPDCGGQPGRGKPHALPAAAGSCAIALVLLPVCLGESLQRGLLSAPAAEIGHSHSYLKFTQTSSYSTLSHETPGDRLIFLPFGCEIFWTCWDKLQWNQAVCVFGVKVHCS